MITLYVETSAVTYWRNLVQFARRRAGELSTNPVFHKLYEVSFLTSRIP